MKFSKSIAACKACGRAFIKVRKGHLFCCVECQRATWKEKGKDKIPPERLCRFNDGVKCPPKGRTCETCNWNPYGGGRKAAQNEKGAWM